MAFGPPKNVNGLKMQTKMSTWTPLNHQLTNDRVFEERRELLGKWVCWNWKTLTELDQLWMSKCLRFGWYINFSPTPHEQSIWKRHYIEMVKELHITRPKTPPKDEFVVPDVQPIAKDVTAVNRVSLPSSRPLSAKLTGKGKKDLPPWRSSDKHPADTIRFNYLDNYDPIEQSRQARRKGGGVTPDLSQQAHEKKKRPSSSSYKLRKVKSLMSLSMEMNSSRQATSRPDWAINPPEGYPVTKETAKTLVKSNEWNAGIRPGPVRPAVPVISGKGRKASMRTQRSSPSSPLFNSQPWQLPPSDGSDEEK
ncbi:F-box only protein 16 isoform X2 [Protopterus annectens]|uniref:F-box only protein 16 isoform X2 n=1 Tax=Protopterus annectens TaxID=7888 RepID=UPI001CFB02D2|nr:F-box only protein 16 isoform X2 [Protopterus annectens]